MSVTIRQTRKDIAAIVAALLAGTDSGLPTLVGGFALHRDLEELVDIGLTPYEALKTSTTYPYEYLGEPSRER